MKCYKIEKVAAKPATTKEVLEKTKCDICKKDILYGGYSADEAEVSAKEGTSYPEGGSGEEYEFDVCVSCFKDQLIPFIESFGNKVRKTDFDY